ncbi:MAG: 1-acyl-sn-glycerol-3-phosphate acyltransferase [Acidobacteriota bacterium]|nr:1-acyl-sn-glycerol-3-phosphate acyltransferase [Acidobacteriota bacterium]
MNAPMNSRPHRVWLVTRSLALWTVTWIHFLVVCLLVLAVGAVVDPRKTDRLQRGFCRNILRLAGVRFEVRCSPGFDPSRTSIFISNHVNIFDPFVIYSAIPQFVRGFELESHFQIPVYGWLMGRFGNVPVPDVPGREGLQIMAGRARAALASGTSLIAFAEGSRTRTGRVQTFKKGIFTIAQKAGVPIVPMSIVGSYEFFRTGHWMLHPGKITIYLHDTIDTAQIARSDVDALRRRVQEIVSAPVEQSMRANDSAGTAPAA